MLQRNEQNDYGFLGFVDESSMNYFLANATMLKIFGHINSKVGIVFIDTNLHNTTASLHTRVHSNSFVLIHIILGDLAEIKWLTIVLSSKRVFENC